MNVTPAILPKSFDEILDKVERVAVFATCVQIDLCDGIMGREKTWLPAGTEVLPHLDTIEYECDVMLVDWRSYLPLILSLGMKRLVMHVDSWSEADMDEFITALNGSSMAVGLAVSNDISFDEFDNKVRYIKERHANIFIQVMGIAKIGEQGQSFDESCIERIRHSKQVFGDLTIQIDGAMRPETAMKVAGVGAEGIVVGSYLLQHEDPSTGYTQLSTIQGFAC